MKSFKLTPAFIRRYPDPINKEMNGEKLNIEHILAVCQTNLLPEGISLEPNPRSQNPDKAIYKKVKESLLSQEDPTFLLKNKGITILAREAKISEDKKEIIVFLEERDGKVIDGIVDGGHTYKIITESNTKNETPDNQFVKIEIITGLPNELISPIAEGLNTAVQVQPMSLSNLSKKFDWIKDELRKYSYFEQISFKENEDGKFDARDIVALMTLFNVDLFPENSNEHPKVAYISKAKCLEIFLDEKNNESYKKIKPILNDILCLYDFVHTRSQDLYNEKFKGKAGALAFYKSRKSKRKYQFIFQNVESQFILYDGALYPMLGALRYLIHQKNNSSEYSWKLGSFDKVLKFYDCVGAELIKITKNTSDGNRKNPNVIGKDENHWAYLYQTVAFEYMKQAK